MIEIQDGRQLAKTKAGLPEKQATPLAVGQLERALLQRWPAGDAEPWDHTGLLVGDPAALVSGVAVCLDPTADAVRAAAEAGANVLLTHHPAFIDPPARLGPSDVVFSAIRAEVALMNFHTALDASVEATRLFPRIMNLDFKRLLSPLVGQPDKGYAALCAVRDSDKPFRLAHLAARATSVFGRQPRVWGDFDDAVATVALCNGSAGDFLDACLDARVDCLVCGEVRYHGALDASCKGLDIVEVGHDVSEFPLCALLAQAAAEAGVAQGSITMIDQSGKWGYPDPERAGA